jgi:hypothetical protein
MRKSVLAISIPLFLTLAGVCWGDPSSEIAYASEKPQYAKLALTQDGSKVLNVVFDESNGTGKGYDVVYADTAFSGRFNKARKVEGTLYKCTSGFHYFFPPIKLKAPYNGKAAGISEPCQATFSYQKHTTRSGTASRVLRSSVVTTEQFAVKSDVWLRDGSTERRYSFSRTLKPAAVSTADAAPIFPRAPTMTVIATPDAIREGNLGLKLDVADADETAGATSPSSDCGCAGTTKDFECQPDVKAHVEIKDSDGRVVHRNDAPLSQFAFG